MEGAGPAAGLPRHTGLLLASNDPTAIDVAQSIIMGYEPFSVPLTKALHNRRLTKWRNIDEINYPLLKAKDLVIPDFKLIEQDKKQSLFNALIVPLFTKHLKKVHRQKEPKPLFDRLICIGCNRCVEICPAKAIILDGEKKAVVDYKACIRCYCCHEVCPVNAIEIEKRE
jgi:ferredoxin